MRRRLWKDPNHVIASGGEGKENKQGKEQHISEGSLQLRPNVSGQVCSDVKDGQEGHGRANSDSETAETTLSEAVTHRKSCSSALRLGAGSGSRDSGRGLGREGKRKPS